MSPDIRSVSVFAGEGVDLSQACFHEVIQCPFPRASSHPFAKSLWSWCLEDIRLKEWVSSLLCLPNRDPRLLSAHAITVRPRATTGVKLRDRELSELVAVCCEVPFAYRCPSAAQATGSALEQGHGRSHR